MKKNPTVQVLMSTFNGQKYLKKQIVSILNQKEVMVHILIRDDGSSDETIKVIKQLKNIYPDSISFYKGKNLGYKKSFLNLINHTKLGYDYYAFADQDDYWLPYKLSSAAEKLASKNNKIKLYASTVIIADENLKPLYTKNINNYVNTFGSCLARIRLAGCTYLFNEKALMLLRLYNLKDIIQTSMPSHDGLLMASCKAVDGLVVVDKNSYILHRRRKDSITSGGNGFFKRLKIEYKLIFKNKNDKTFLAKLLKENLNGIPTTNMLLINKIISYRYNIRNTFSLCFDRNLNCGLSLGNIETKLRILLRLF